MNSQSFRNASSSGFFSGLLTRAGALAAVGLSALSGAGCSSLDVLNAIAAAPSGPTTSFAYGDHPRQRVDLYQPVGHQGLRPVLVFFYGGSWNSGDRADYRFVAKAAERLGMVLAVPDYRLAPEVVYPDFLRDSADALAEVRRRAAEFGGDPDRLIVMGHSAGAYNAAMLAYDDRWLASEDRSSIRGFIGLAGPYDFLPIQIPSVQTTFGWPHTPRSSQPVEHVSPGDPPALLLAAEKDHLVLPETNTQSLARRLRLARVPVEVEMFSTVSHTTLVAALVPPFSYRAPVVDRIAAFLDRLEPTPP